MILRSFLNEAIQRLKNSSIATARLDAEVIVAHALGVDRSWLHAHSENELPKDKEVELLKKIERRTKNEPVAYILGHKEFYGRNFIVNRDVLVPRPESETIIDLLLNHIKGRELNVEVAQVIDVGTGSGNLIITADLELSKVENLANKFQYIGLDISEDALIVARKNSSTLKAKVDYKKFDLMSKNITSILSSQFSILLANLPYVPADYRVNEPAKHEPGIALFSGNDGLKHYRKLFENLAEEARAKERKLIVITESLIQQHAGLELIARKAGFKLIESRDLVQTFEN